jgi:Amidohydrolase
MWVIGVAEVVVDGDRLDNARDYFDAKRGNPLVITAVPLLRFRRSSSLSARVCFLDDNCWSELQSRLLDIQDRRLRLMDEFGMEMMLLSLNAPAIQSRPDAKVADELAKRANDFLAEQVAKNPSRFQALAALPLQDPDFAIAELQRCVTQLGFKGVLVNGFSQIGSSASAVYYDLPQYRAFWAEVERLDVPCYLHPRNPLPEHSQIYEGHSWLLGPTWAFGQETADAILTLLAAGVNVGDHDCRLRRQWRPPIRSEKIENAIEARLSALSCRKTEIADDVARGSLASIPTPFIEIGDSLDASHRFIADREFAVGDVVAVGRHAPIVIDLIPVIHFETLL